MDKLKTYIQKLKYYYKKTILFFENRFNVHEGAVLAMLAMLLFLTIGAVAGRPPRKRNLTTTPLLWSKLDGTLTDENSTGSTFAYSPGKPATETGVSIKEGDNIQYSPGSTIDSGSSVYENWNPNQGTMNVWVQPNWPGNDNTRHDIWNGDYGRIDTADSNLKAYFKFDEGSEDFAFDSSSNSNIGYLHGPALSFDGGDYVINTSSTGLPTTIGTIEVWSKHGTLTPVEDTIVELSDGSASNRIVLSLTSNTDMHLYIKGVNVAVKSSVIVSNKWQHVTVTWNTTIDEYKIYIDGSDTAATQSPTSDPSGIDEINIGCDFSESQLFNGQINNVRIYSRALSATEVGQHYVGNYADESGLVGYWPMDENQGQYVYDQSGNSNNGTLGATSGSSTDDPTWVNYAPGWTEEGRFGKGVVFDGTDDELEINDINF